MLVRGMIQHHFDDDSDPTAVGGIQQLAEIRQGSVAGVNSVVIRYVVTVVAQRRRKEWHQPDGVDPQFLKISELLLEPLKVSDAVAITVIKSTNVHLLDDCVLVPEHILIQRQRKFLLGLDPYRF